MESFTNLLTDAFSETTVPSISDEDLEFLDSDEQSWEDERERVTKSNGARMQEAASEREQALREDVEDLFSIAEHTDDGINEMNPKADGVILINTHRAPNTSTNSEFEFTDKDSSSEDWTENLEEYGEKLKSLVSLSGTGGKFSSEEDSDDADEELLALESSADLRVSSKEKAEAQSNEEVSCFGNESEQGCDVMTEIVACDDDAQESDERDSSSDSESKTFQSEEHFLTGNSTEKENDGATRRVPAEDPPIFPGISVQNLQDLIAEIDSEESVNDMKDFSGEEHQEAGEKFAEYPSELSFFEYVEDDEKYEINNQLNAALLSVDCCSNEKHDSTVEATGVEEVCTGSLTTYSTTEEKNEMIIKEDQKQSEDVFIQNKDQQNPETKKQTEDFGLSRESSTAPSNCGLYYSGDNHPGYFRWDSEELGTCYTPQDVEKKGKKGTQCPVVEISDFSEVESEGYRAMAASSQWLSENESFLSCHTESPAVPEKSGCVHKKEINWEPTQERIMAFYKYYDDDEEEEEDNERQIKVQFCADPFSQVIHYESESSDSESVSSSTDRAEDLSAADTSDDQTHSDNLQVMPGCDFQKTQRAETIPDRRHTHSYAGERKCGRLLKLVLKTTLYTLMGILIFWIFFFPDHRSHGFDN